MIIRIDYQSMYLYVYVKYLMVVIIFNTCAYVRYMYNIVQYSKKEKTFYSYDCSWRVVNQTILNSSNLIICIIKFISYLNNVNFIQKEGKFKTLFQGLSKEKNADVWFNIKLFLFEIIFKFSSCLYNTDGIRKYSTYIKFVFWFLTQLMWSKTWW